MSAPARWNSSSTPRRHVLLHGDEHPAAGRASGDGNDHRPRPGRVAVARRRRRAAAADAGAIGHSWPCAGSAHLCRRSGQGLPALDRPPGPPGAAGRVAPCARRYRRRAGRRNLAALRPDDRQTDRLGRDPRAGAGPHAPGAGAVPRGRRGQQRGLSLAPGRLSGLRPGRPRHRADRAAGGLPVSGGRRAAQGSLAGGRAGRTAARTGGGGRGGAIRRRPVFALASPRRLAPEQRGPAQAGLPPRQW